MCVVKILLPDCPSCKGKVESAFVKRLVFRTVKRKYRGIWCWVKVGFYCRRCDEFFLRGKKAG